MKWTSAALRALLGLALATACVGPGTASALPVDAPTTPPAAEHADLFSAIDTQAAPPARALSEAERERVLDGLIDEIADGRRVTLPTAVRWNTTDRQARRLQALAWDRSRPQRARAAAALLLQTRTDAASRAIALDVMSDAVVEESCRLPPPTGQPSTDEETADRIACAEVLHPSP